MAGLWLKVLLQVAFKFKELAPGPAAPRPRRSRAAAVTGGVLPSPPGVSLFQAAQVADARRSALPRLGVRPPRRAGNLVALGGAPEARLEQRECREEPARKRWEAALVAHAAATDLIVVTAADGAPACGPVAQGGSVELHVPDALEGRHRHGPAPDARRARVRVSFASTRARAEGAFGMRGCDRNIFSTGFSEVVRNDNRSGWVQRLQHKDKISTLRENATPSKTHRSHGQT